MNLKSVFGKAINKIDISPERKHGETYKKYVARRKEGNKQANIHMSSFNYIRKHGTNTKAWRILLAQELSKELANKL